MTEDHSEPLDGHRDLAPRGGLELHELAEPGAELSTGLILSWRSSLVFALAPRAEALGSRGQPAALAFVGIGGHLDPGEGWEAAVTREAVEEAGCAISISDSPVTYLCRPDQSPQPLVYRWSEPHRPLLVWVATFALRRGPDRVPTPVTLVNAVFQAAALNAPSPGMEVSGLLLTDRETLLHTYQAPRPLAELLARGAHIIGQPPPPDTYLAPGGSAYFLAQWLQWQEDH